MKKQNPKYSTRKEDMFVKCSDEFYMIQNMENGIFPQDMKT